MNTSIRTKYAIQIDFGEHIQAKTYMMSNEKKWTYPLKKRQKHRLVSILVYSAIDLYINQSKYKRKL